MKTSLPFFSPICFLGFLFLLLGGPTSSVLAQIGPGLGNLTYSSGEQYTSIATINSPKVHGNVAMVQGYLFVPFAEDGGVNGGFDFFDVSNPRNPTRAYQKFDASTADIREPHGFGISTAWGGITLAYPTQTGFKIFDLTNPSNVSLISSVTLPGVNNANYGGVWWLHFQAPYVFAGAWEQGVYVVDCSDLQNPVVVKQITRANLGNTRTGPVFVVGNLLVVGDANMSAVATMDITDPLNPIFLDKRTLIPSYSWHVNGGKIFGAGLSGDLVIADISNPANIINRGQVSNVGNRGGYITTQDNFVHAGYSNRIGKIDISNPNNFVLVRSYTANIPAQDEDFAVPLGNLIWGGDDHGVGSGLLVHQTSPDNTPPEVNMVMPGNNFINQGLSTRVGLTMTDQILMESVDENSFIVKELNGGQIAGKYSTQLGIVSFVPDQPLSPNTTYEVIVPSNGMQDFVGNATATSFTSVFSTGPVIETRVVCNGLNGDAAETGVPTTITASLSATLTGLSYEWDMGDNSPIQVTSSPAITYTYASPGSYLVRLSVVNGGTTISTCATTQTVTGSSNSGTSQRTTDIIYDNSADKVWVVNPDNNTVTRINALNPSKEVEITVGEHPRSLAQAPDNSIWIVNQNSASISIIPSGSNSVSQTMSLPYASQPYGILFNEQTGFAYVSLQATGEVAEIDPSSRSITRRVSVGRWPRAMALNGDGSQLYITRFISGNSQGEVYRVNTNTFNPMSTIGLAIDPGPDASDRGRGLPNYLAGIAISPNGNEAWITSKKDNIQRGLQRDGLSLIWENTIRAITSVANLNSSSEELAKRIDIDNSDSPTAIEFTKLGDMVFIAIQGNNRVEVRNVFNKQVIATLDNTGSAPQGLVLSPDNSRLFVHNFLSRNVAVYDVEDIVDGSSSLETLLASVSTVSNENLTNQSLQGKRIFYFAEDTRMSRDGYISCASCHVDGKEDGRNWDFSQFGSGNRNTISLLGRAGMAQGFVHWAGDFDEIQDFEGQIRALGNGTGFMSNADFFSGTRSLPLGDTKAGISPDLDAIAAYVNSLDEFEKSPYRNSSGNLTSNGQAGKTIFNQLNCGSCHSTSDFTDSFTGLRHDVGTIQSTSGTNLLGLDVPTLKDVWSTAPYLHDGSAESLMDVLTTRNPGNKHADVSSLSSQDLNNLVAYLQQIDADETQSTQPAYSLTQSQPLTGSEHFVDTSIPLEINTNISGISAVEYYANGNLIATANSAPWNASWTSSSQDDYTLEAKVIHTGGRYGTVAQRIFISISDPCEGLGPVIISPAGPFTSDQPLQTLVGSPSGGSWGGDANADGTFDPSQGAGTYTVSYTVDLGGGCIIQESISIEVNEPGDPCEGEPEVTIDPAGPFTTDQGIQQLTADPIGGTWSGSANADGTFDPSQGAGTYQVTYTVDFGNGCIKSVDADIEVTEPTDPCAGQPAVTIDPAGPFTTDESIQQLTGNPSGGTWSGSANGDGTFDPSQGAGTYQVTYTVDFGNGCIKSIDADIEVNDPVDPCAGQPDVTIDPAGPYTTDEGIQQLTANPSGGTWSGSANADGTFDPSQGAGTYTVSYTVDFGDGCVKSTDASITVSDPPSGECTVPYNLALNQPSSQSSTNGDGVASFTNDGNTVGDNFSGADANLSHTAFGDNQPWWKVDLGSISTLDRAVLYNRNTSNSNHLRRLKNFYLYFSDSDIDGERSHSSLKNDGSIEWVYFSGELGTDATIQLNDIQARHMTLKLVGNGPLHIAELELYGCPGEGGPVDPCLGQPDVTINLAGPFTTDQGIQQLTANPSGGTWSGAANADGTFDPSQGAGSYTVTYTVDLGNGCIKSTDASIEVTSPSDPCAGQPDVTIDPAGPFTTDQGIQQLTGNPSGGTWSGSANAAGTFDPSQGAGTYTVSYTVDLGNGCVKSTDATIDVTDPSDPCAGQPAVTINPAGPFTSDQGVQQLSGNPTGGTWSGSANANGTFDPSQGAGAYTVTYTVDFGAGCVKSTDATITVSDPPSGECTVPYNLALNQPSSQSSTNGDGVASFTNDGNPVGDDFSGADANLSHTEFGDNQPWWKVDLGSESTLDRAVLYNRNTTNSNHLRRLKNFYLYFSDSDIDGERSHSSLKNDGSIEWVYFSGELGTDATIQLNDIQARHMTLKLVGNGPLHMAELELYGCPGEGGPVDPCIGQPDVTINPAGPFTTDQGIQQLTANPSGGTWSGAANSNGTFDPSQGAGSYTVTYTVDFGDGCIKSDDLTITVTAPRRSLCRST